MKTVTKLLNPGKWRIKLKSGHVTGARLVGMRQRRHILHEWPRSDFYAHVNKGANGTVMEDVVTRGVPLAYLQDGPYLMLWPAPAHEWQLEYDMVEKADERVFGRQGTGRDRPGNNLEGDSNPD